MLVLDDWALSILAGRCPNWRVCVDTTKGERSLLTVTGPSATLSNFFVTTMCRASYVKVSDRLSRRDDSFRIASFAVIRWRPRLNANVVTGCKRRNISTGTVNYTRTKGRQWWTFCLRTAKKEYPKSATQLLRLEEKRFVQGVCYFINKIRKLILNRSKCAKY
jgi:hypothetical protein